LPHPSSLLFQHCGNRIYSLAPLLAINQFVRALPWFLVLKLRRVIRLLATRKILFELLLESR